MLMIQLSVEDFEALMECLERAADNARGIAAEFSEKSAEEEAKEANRLYKLLEDQMRE